MFWSTLWGYRSAGNLRTFACILGHLRPCRHGVKPFWIITQPPSRADGKELLCIPSHRVGTEAFQTAITCGPCSHLDTFLFLNLLGSYLVELSCLVDCLPNGTGLTSCLHIVCSKHKYLWYLRKLVFLLPKGLGAACHLKLQSGVIMVEYHGLGLLQLLRTQMLRP